MEVNMEAKLPERSTQAELGYQQKQEDRSGGRLNMQLKPQGLGHLANSGKTGVAIR
jgi:hypothetical protein